MLKVYSGAHTDGRSHCRTGHCALAYRVTLKLGCRPHAFIKKL